MKLPTSDQIQEMLERLPRILQYSDDRPFVAERIKQLIDDWHRLIAKTRQMSEILYCEKASGICFDQDVLLVFAGSIARTAGNGDLVKSGVLQKKGDEYIFTRDYVFHKPSPAAFYALGRQANGWQEWKNKKGKPLSELREGCQA